MNSHRGLTHPSPWLIGAALLLALLAVAPRLVNLDSRPLMHDESLFGFYSYEAMRHLQEPKDPGKGRRNPIYTHMPLMHGPTLMLMTAVAFDWLGDSIAVARGLVALWSLAALAGVLALWPRRLKWWLAPLLFVSPTLLFYSRFFRDDMFFNGVLMLGMLGVARGLSRRRGHVAWSVAGMAFMLALLTIMENAVFVYASGVTFAAVYGLLCLVRRVRPAWSRALRGLRPRRRRPLAFLEEIKAGRQRRRSKPRETYLKPSFEEVVGEPVGAATQPAALAAPVAEAVFRRFRDRWPSVLGWIAGMLLGVTLIAVLFGQLTGQAPVQLNPATMQPYQRNLLELAQTLGLPAVARNLGLANIFASWQYWAGQHAEQRIAGPLHYHLPILVTYELPLLLLIYIGIGWDATLRGRRTVLHGAAILAWLVLWRLWRWAYPGVVGWIRPIDELEQLPVAWLGPINDAAHFLHIVPDLSMLILGLLIVPILSWSLLKLIEHRPLAAWMGWWAACSLFQYSSAGEKVPWLAVHIVVPFYAVAGWIWGGVLTRRGTAARRTLLALAAAGTLIGLRNDLRLIDEDQANPRERLVFNHTTQRVDTTIKNRLAEWNEFADKAPLAKRRVLLADDPAIGGPSWPGFWYFRRCQYVITTAPGPMLNQPWDLVLGTQQVLQPLLGQLERERWNPQEMSLRDHWWGSWPDEARWRAWLYGKTDMLGQHPRLGELIAQSLPLWWQYYWNRIPWTDPGHYPIIVLTPQHVRRE